MMTPSAMGENHLHPVARGALVPYACNENGALQGAIRRLKKRNSYGRIGGSGRGSGRGAAVGCGGRGGRRWGGSLAFIDGCHRRYLTSFRYTTARHAQIIPCNDNAHARTHNRLL